ncbi:restriction endonuclease subunit S [Nitrosomonas sp.]|uniref:restriction endonuclease subunit S n=1 Tax=Nitrosomonas sp. TaxID=42353 RepID=UPI002730F410|nr:restriction endonuclease subunit S [Nitrosomonas sp.]MDP2225593.1 restriction endonuclease subunit S [Nitrosomonas sp.]
MNVPRLRFKDVDEREFPEWEEKKLGEVASFIKDGTHGTHQDTVNGEYFLLSAKNIKNGGIYHDESDRKISKIEFEAIYKNYKLIDGDVLLSVVGTIGRVAIYSSIFHNVAFQRSVAFFRFKSENSRFMAQLFTTNKFQNALLTNQVVSAQPGIYLGDLAKIQINLPSAKEQTKIANFLTAIDEKIFQLTQKYDLLVQSKKGVMQQIFSQKLRFRDDDGGEFPEWEDKTIDAVAEVTTGDKDTQNKIDDGAYPFFVRSQTVERINSYSFDGEAILTSGDGVGVGKNYHYIIGKFDFHQRVYCLHSFKIGVNGRFIFHYFSEHFNKRVMQLSAKNSVDSVRRSMVTDMPIYIPTYQEQTKIANFLTAIDDKITLTKTQLDAVKLYKKGLLQQLFV